MVRILGFFAGVALAAALVPTSAWACDPDLRLTQAPSAIDYDSFDGAQRIEPFEIEIVNNGETACVGQLIVGMATTPRAFTTVIGNELAFDVIPASSVSPRIYDPASNISEPISIRVPPRQVRRVAMRLRLPPGQTVPAGDYSAALDFQLASGPQAGNPGGGLPVDFPSVARTIVLYADVTPRVQANFTGISASDSGRVGMVDLGEITSNELRDFGIQIRSNVDVDIAVRSEGRGYLTHDEDPEAKIPFALIVAGQPIDLSADSSVPGATSLTGTTNAIQLRVGSTDGARSGEYADDIVFTISGR